jgi:glycosyltransferase involved in cell wall biosynthesis
MVPAPLTCRPDGHGIHVLFFLPVLGTGGTERLVSDLSVGLRAAGYRVSVAAFEGGALGDEIAGNGFDLYLLAEGIQRHKIGKLVELRRRLSRLLAGDIDVVHSHHMGTALHLLAASGWRRRWCWVHTEHTRIDIDHAYPPLLTRLAPSLLRLPDVVTGVSDAVCDYYTRKAAVPAGRIEAIYNGIDVERFARSSGRDMRAELGIPANAWVIGMVANFRVQKNHSLAFRAFQRVRSVVPDARLVLAGDGELAAALKTEAHVLGIDDSVMFLGTRRDVPDLLGMFDVFCLPSHVEGMPLTIFETMAARCPIVATAVLGIWEVVEHDVSGLLVPPGNVEALAGALLQVHEDRGLADHLVDGGWRYVHEHARFEVMCRQYATLYTRLVSARPGAFAGPP